jgi:hypothetical protein
MISNFIENIWTVFTAVLIIKLRKTQYIFEKIENLKFL